MWPHHNVEVKLSPGTTTTGVPPASILASQLAPAELLWEVTMQVPGNALEVIGAYMMHI